MRAEDKGKQRGDRGAATTGSECIAITGNPRASAQFGHPSGRNPASLRTQPKIRARHQSLPRARHQLDGPRSATTPETPCLPPIRIEDGLAVSLSQVVLSASGTRGAVGNERATKSCMENMFAFRLLSTHRRRVLVGAGALVLATACVSVAQDFSDVSPSSIGTGPSAGAAGSGTGTTADSGRSGVSTSFGRAGSFGGPGSFGPHGSLGSGQGLNVVPGAPDPYSLVRADGTPFVFQPDVLSVPSPGDVLESLNTPSGSAPFAGSSTIGRGLQLQVSEAVRFDDNARRLANGALPPLGGSKADSYSVTNFGASYARDISLQTIFLRGDYGLTRYRKNSDLDNSRYNIAAGINWRIASSCQGSLVASASQNEVEFQDLAVGSAVSLSNSERLDLQGRCHLYGNLYATFGASALDTTVSTSPINDARRQAVRGGIEYSVPQLHTIGFEASHNLTNFSNRISTPLSPLTTELKQDEYRGYYNYIVSPKTTISLSGGIIQSSSSLGASQSQPVAAASINWRPTPKLLFTAGGQLTASAAQTVAADFQRTQTAIFGVIYNITPKLNLSAIYASTRQTQAVLSTVGGPTNGRETQTNTVSIDANYQASPFLFAGLGYRFSEQTARVSGQQINSNLYTISLSYRR